MHTDPNCIFCKIAEGKIPSKKVHEDDEMIVFHDINPWAPVHFLMVPKEHIPSMAQVEDRHAPLLGRMMVLATVREVLCRNCRNLVNHYTAVGEPARAKLFASFVEEFEAAYEKHASS